MVYARRRGVARVSALRTSTGYDRDRFLKQSERNSGRSSMMPLRSYGILGWPWQRVLHMSLFLLYHLRRLVLWSLHIIPAHSLECYTWNVGDCLIGHHRRW